MAGRVAEPPQASCLSCPPDRANFFRGYCAVYIGVSHVLFLWATRLSLLWPFFGSRLAAGLSHVGIWMVLYYGAVSKFVLSSRGPRARRLSYP